MTKPGLRLRVLLLLGGLLALTFPPLQLALWAYTNVTLQTLDEEDTDSRLLALNALIDNVPEGRVDERWLNRLWVQADAWQLAAITSANPRPGWQLGAPTLLAQLRAAIPPSAGRWLLRDNEALYRLTTLNTVPPLRIAVRSGRATSRGPALVQAFALYAFLIACALLVVAYFALTRWLVQPLDQLARAAENVTLGARHLKLPAMGVRELDHLGLSVERMAARLLRDEHSLRLKVQEVERATHDLRDAQAQLVRSERLASVGRLSAGLAHEIGNPLAALTGLADLMLEGGLSDEEQHDFLGRMRGETTRIHKIISELLQFSRPSDSNPNAKLVPADVETAVHETLVLLSHQQSMKLVSLALDLFPELPPVSLSDPALRQVLMNLLLNAADALHGRENAKIRISAIQIEARVQLRIADNGPGISDSVAERIFDPFFTTKDVGEGTGLGLSVCQGLVAAAGGNIWLEPNTEPGAHFVIELPVFKTEPPHHSPCLV